MSLWGYMFYTSNPALYISDTSGQDSTAPSSSFSSSAAVPVSKDTHTNTSTSGSSKGRFLIDFKAVKAAAQDMLLMPATHILKVQLPSRRRGVRGRIVDPEQSTRLARLEKRNSRSGTVHSSTGHSKGFRAELLQAVPEDVVTIMDTNLCKLKIQVKLTDSTVHTVYPCIHFTAHMVYPCYGCHLLTAQNIILT
jgi:hypothetical protein